MYKLTIKEKQDGKWRKIGEMEANAQGFIGIIKPKDKFFIIDLSVFFEEIEEQYSVHGLDDWLSDEKREKQHSYEFTDRLDSTYRLFWLGKVEPKKPKTAASQSIKTWFEVFPKYPKLVPLERRKLNELEFTKEEVEAFKNSREWYAKTKDVSSFISHIQKVRIAMKGSNGNGFPDHYSASFEAKLPTEERPKYWAHLRELGYKPIKNKTGKVVNWEKEKK